MEKGSGFHPLHDGPRWLGTHPWKPLLAHEALLRCRGAGQLSDNHVGLAISTVNDGDFLWREVTKMLRALKAAGYKIVGVLEQGTWHFHTVKLRRSLFACMKSTSIVQSRTRETHLRAPTSLGDVSACTLEVGHVSGLVSRRSHPHAQLLGL